MNRRLRSCRSALSSRNFFFVEPALVISQGPPTRSCGGSCSVIERGIVSDVRPLVCHLARVQKNSIGYNCSEHKKTVPFVLLFSHNPSPQPYGSIPTADKIRVGMQ